MEIFESFFGTVNPYHIAIDENGQQIAMIEKIESDIHKNYVTPKETAAKDLRVQLFCTLKELYYGATKQLSYTRFQVSETSALLVGDLAKVSNSSVQKEIHVQPGMRDGTELRFPGLGNDPAVKRAGDLVVVIRQIEHTQIKRQGDDLIYTHKISLKDALTSAPVQFETLDGQVIKYTSDDVVNPKT